MARRGTVNAEDGGSNPSLTATLKCECCGKEGPDVEECEDPYSREINDIIELVILCKGCYQERCDDI